MTSVCKGDCDGADGASDDIPPDSTTASQPPELGL